MYEFIFSYPAYYASHLLVNVFLLSLYSIQMYIEHKPCTSSSGENITSDFKFAFGFGLFSLIAEVVNTQILAIYFRSLKQA